MNPTNQSDRTRHELTWADIPRLNLTSSRQNLTKPDQI